jgi:Fungal specific transcription factor domain
MTCIYQSPEQKRATKSAPSSETYVTPPERPLSRGVSFPPLANSVSLKSSVESFALIEDDVAKLPESKERRLLELRLQHNYMDRISQPFDLPQSPIVTSAWQEDVPRLALEYENLLYAMFSISATSLLRDTPGDQKLFAARESYNVLALGAQRRALENLSAESADATCFASLFILINAFAVLHERVHETGQPYSPPMQWLLMCKGAKSIIRHVLYDIPVDQNGDDRKSHRIRKVLTSGSTPWNESTLDDEAKRKNFLGTLTQSIPSMDDWTDETTRETYEKTLSYIGGLQWSLQSGEPGYSICKRIICFGMFVPPMFIQFVSEKRPRSLVILAHFFAIVAQVKAVWWLGDTARKEIEGIKGEVPSEWQGLMMWPLAMADGMIS